MNAILTKSLGKKKQLTPPAPDDFDEEDDIPKWTEGDEECLNCRES